MTQPIRLIDHISENAAIHVIKNNICKEPINVIRGVWELV